MRECENGMTTSGRRLGAQAHTVKSRGGLDQGWIWPSALHQITAWYSCVGRQMLVHAIRWLYVVGPKANCDFANSQKGDIYICVPT